MYLPTQARTITISGAALPAWVGQPVLSVVGIRGREKLGRLSRYEVELKTAHSPNLPVWEARDLVIADKLVGTEITLSIEFDGKGEFIPGLPGGLGLGNQGAGTREIAGVITKVTFTGEDDRHAYSRMSLRPWLWLATRNRENRIFQNQSVVDITQAVLGSKLYPFQYELQLGAPGLRGVYPKRDYVRQMWESDFDFLTRLWREWGLYYFMDGATLVLCDSPGSHRPHGNMYDTILYHAPHARRIDEEHIHRFKVSRGLTAGIVRLVDYDPTQPRARLAVEVDRYSERPFDNAEHYCWGDYSQPRAGTMGLSGEPNDYEREARYLAGVRADAERCRSLRARGRGNLRGLATGHTFHLEGHPQTRVNAEYLVVASTLDLRDNSETTGDRQYQCVTDFVVQPANTFFKNRPKERPRCGPETAVVVGPQDQPMWVDGYARVKVQFVWDRLGASNENSSCWVRVSSPWQGSGFGFVALPRIGQEVTIHYHEDDPDKPYVSGRQVNAFNQPPWELPKNQALTGWRSCSLNGSRSNQVVADDTPGKLQVQVASDHANSRLVLGYNVRIEGRRGRQQERGEGFELATMAWGVVRANRGMLVTTEARTGATEPAKDMGETLARLIGAREQHDELSQIAQRHEAQAAHANQNDAARGVKAQNDAIRGHTASPDDPFPELSRPDLLLASAAGVAITSADSTHLASQQDHAVTAGRDVSISGGRSLFAAVRGAISLFAYRLGLKLIAAKGKVEIQAQSDEMALTALKDLTIASTDGKLVLNAAKEVWIGAGGSYIRINGQGIENGTPGHILEKCAKWDKLGTASVQLPMDALPILAEQRLFSNRIDLFEAARAVSETAHPWSNLEYFVTERGGNNVASGVLDEFATIPRFHTRVAQDIDVWVGARGAWEAAEEALVEHNNEGESA